MQIQKIKLKDNGVTITYTKKNENDSIDTIILDSQDEPRPALKESLQNLKSHLADHFYINDENIDNIGVTGIRQVDLGDTFTTIITGKISGKFGTSALVTPQMNVEVSDVIKQAKKYLAGERAQLEVFQEEPEEAAA